MSAWYICPVCKARGQAYGLVKRHIADSHGVKDPPVRIAEGR